MQANKHACTNARTLMPPPGGPLMELPIRPRDFMPSTMNMSPSPTHLTPQNLSLGLSSGASPSAGLQPISSACHAGSIRDLRRAVRSLSEPRVLVQAMRPCHPDKARAPHAHLSTYPHIWLPSHSCIATVVCLSFPSPQVASGGIQERPLMA